ncbi:MAG: hypothetical protein AB7I79_23840 [Rhizobiaceae bacterium]
MRSMRLKTILAALTVPALLGCAPADAEPVAIRLRIVDENGGAIGGLALSVLVVAGPDSLREEAGEEVVTDAQGRTALDVDAEVDTRLMTLDNPLMPHRATHLGIGIEMDHVGRRALYIVELDAVSGGTVGKLTANVAGPDGVFDDPLTFHPDNHAWSFPDQPDGMLMTSIGADLNTHALERRDGIWTVEIELEKQTFTVR